jgi:hypothetical protein
MDAKYNPIKQKKHLSKFFSFLVIVQYFFPLFTSAQDNYKLFINIVKEDNAVFANDSLKLLQPFGLQTSFNSITLCSSYVYRLTEVLATKGFPAASVDSVHFGSLSAQLYLYTGPQYKWIELTTDSVEKKILDLSGINEKRFAGNKIDFNQLEARLQRMLNYYENNGYPFAQIKLDSIQIHENFIKAHLKVNKGILYHIDSTRVYGKVKIKNTFLQRYTGINNGSIYNYEKLKNVSKRLSELPYLQEQHPFDVSMLGTGATLNLYLVPKRSSQINFLVGFLPGDNITGKSQLTGDINLDLKNALGSGENIILNWQQLQRKSPRLNIGYKHPYIFNSAFGIDFTFDLFKRDSSFLQLHTQLGLQYILSANHSGKIFIQNQRAYLLQGGYDTNRIKIFKTLPSNIDVNSNNIGIDYEWINTNYKFNPAKGNEVRLVATVGLKNISKNNDIINLKNPANPGFTFNSLYDSLKLKTYQVRFTLKAARYFAVAKTSTLKMGVSAGVFESGNIFRNELFQIGGYRLLRGFNEESIYVNQYGVFTAEYRYLVGLNSYIFGFTDISLTRSRYYLTNITNNFIGAGLGLTLETKSGLLNLSYAIGKRNDVKFDIRNSSKIHFGYINYF